ncbi:MAG: hypothetical protein II453_01885 [Alphaproteobacteria bacterium]|nr:hypothetical protein [Alphaproteobacteria bacterium]
MQIRLSFKHKYCKTLQLPSGNWSDYDLFPIAEDEVRSLTKDLTGRPKGPWITNDEYLLWVALRRKYGVNYLKPKPQRFLQHIDNLYAEPQKDDSLEDKLLAYCDGRMGEMMDIILQKSAPEKNKKNFRLSLDNGDFDAIIDSEQEQKTTKGEANE